MVDNSMQRSVHKLQQFGRSLNLPISSDQHNHSSNIELVEPSEVLVNVVSREDVPPDGGYGWVCAFCVFMINAHTWGINSAWAIFLSYYLEQSTFPGTTQFEYALIGGLSVSQALIISPVIAASMKVFGTNLTLAIGTALVFAALLGASYATEMWHLFLSQGICFGFGMGFLYIPATAVLPQWFSSKRSLAVGIATSGAGLGGVLYNLVAGVAARKLGLQWTYRILAICSLVMNTICSILLRDRNKMVKPKTESFDYRELGHIEVVLVIAWGVLAELGYIVLLYSLPHYATTIGLSQGQGAVVGALLNVGLGGGRPLIGYLSDRWGRINMAMLMTASCGVFCLALWLPTQSYTPLLVFALCAGFGCGTFWGTMSAVTAEVVGLKRLPTTFGVICICLVAPTTFAEPIGLEIVAARGYKSAQIFVGFMFILSASCTWFLRSWKICEIEAKAAREEATGSGRGFERSHAGFQWLSPMPTTNAIIGAETHLPITTTLTPGQAVILFSMPQDQIYPRPDFQRYPLNWKSLDGDWDFAYDDNDTGLLNEWQQGIPSDKKRKIKVPFVYQTPASGLDEQQAHQIVWYETPISFVANNLPVEEGYRTIIHFGAVDYEAKVWLNGIFLGTHRGGHVPFEFDITENLSEQSHGILTVRVWDAATDLTQPRGKQYWAAKPEGIFYTPSTGIWQSVWLENTPRIRLAGSSHGTVIKSHDIESGELEVEVSVVGRRKVEDVYVTIEASLGGLQIARSEPTKVDGEKDVAKVRLNLRLSDEQKTKLPSAFTDAHAPTDDYCWHQNLAIWTPEHPILYNITITLAADEKANLIYDTICTTAGMRSINWNTGDGTFRLNGRPYFQALVLDQGYWPNTNITPPTSESCKEDIILAKKMGFNGCRKHQKVEDPLFLYWADRLGYLVWGEMANGYEFSSQYVERFDHEWKEAVKRDLNHPCIVAWTPVNETWGYGALKDSVVEQNHIRSLYYLTKTLDPTRPINDNCGWEHVCTDLTTFHDYSDGPQLRHVCESMEEILKPKAGREMFVSDSSHQKGAPVICTEFGGVNIALREGEKGITGEWGYTTATNSQDLLARVKRLMLAVVEGGHCCGFVYTQLTDIEQETNGLYTFDRKEKLPASEVAGIISEVRRTYFQKLESRK